MAEPKRRITVRMPLSTFERLTKLAQIEQRSMNKEVIHIFTDALQNQGQYSKESENADREKAVHVRMADYNDAAAKAIPIRASVELHKALEDLAAKNRQSLNAQNLEILERYIDQRAHLLDKAN